MRKILQEDAYKNILKKCEEKNYTLIDNFIYINNSTKIHLKCNKDNYEWYVSYHNYIDSNQGCSKCAGNLRNSQEKVEYNVSKICEEKNYTIIESINYVNWKTQIHLKCNKDNYEWYVRYNNLMNGAGCPKCSNRPNITQEEAISKILNICKEKNYTLMSTFFYKNAHTKIHLKCNKHNHMWYSTFNILSNNSFCKLCGFEKTADKKRLSDNDINYNISKICQEKNYRILDIFEYKNNKSKIHLKCLNDNNEWYINYNNLLNNKGCPECGRRFKKSENRIKKLLDDNDIKYIYQYKNKIFLNNQSLDFFLPEYNIAIEYQGIQHFKAIDYFGGEKAYQKNIIRDNNKYNICKENNIKLLYFTYEKNINNYNYIDKVYTLENKLIEKIKKNEFNRQIP